MSQKQVPFNWPVDKKGNPKALITSSMEELIPTAKYANTKMFAAATRFVDDTDEGIRNGVSKTYDLVEEALIPQREEIMRQLEEGD